MMARQKKIHLKQKSAFLFKYLGWMDTSHLSGNFTCFSHLWCQCVTLRNNILPFNNIIDSKFVHYLFVNIFCYLLQSNNSFVFITFVHYILWNVVSLLLVALFVTVPSWLASRLLLFILIGQQNTSIYPDWPNRLLSFILIGQQITFIYPDWPTYYLLSCLIVITFLCYLMMSASRNVIDWWLSNWVSHSHSDTVSNGTASTGSLFNLLLASLPDGRYQYDSHFFN